MESIPLKEIIEILNALDPSLKVQSIQVNHPPGDNLSIFFRDKKGVFTHRVIHLPDKKMTDQTF